MSKTEHKIITEQLRFAEMKNKQYESRIQQLRNMIAALRSGLKKLSENDLRLALERESSKKRAREFDTKSSGSKKRKIEILPVQTKQQVFEEKKSTNVAPPVNKVESTENTIIKPSNESSTDVKPQERKPDFCTAVKPTKSKQQRKKERKEAIINLNWLGTKAKLQETLLAKYCKFTITHECSCWVAVDCELIKQVQKKKWQYGWQYKAGQKFTLVFQRVIPNHKPSCASIFNPSSDEITVTNCSGDAVSFCLQPKAPFIKSGFANSPGTSYRLTDSIGTTACTDLKLFTQDPFITINLFGLQLQKVPTDSGKVAKLV